ncbi:SphA family protein [Undibacterium sp. Ren11W]|uniref:SphA family protein n=1 Tax=Undibacterium sp. Ren11W TaxID=3413045 RepID=UPI003BF011E8
MQVRKSLLLIASATSLLGASQFVSAAENSEIAAPIGIWGLDSAILPVSGVYGQIIAPSYRASAAKDGNGDDVSFAKSVPGIPVTVRGTVSAKIKVDAIVPKLVYISPDPILGGRIGAYIAVPLLNKSRDVVVNVTTPLPAALQQKIGQSASLASSGHERGLGDVETTAFIGWKYESLSLVAAMNVDLPTGSFDKNSQVNLGMNSYSYRPLISAAWSTESGFDFAGSLAYNYSTANRTTSYKSGQYLHAEYVGTYQFSNNIKAGLQGYYINQTTDDSDPMGASAVPILNGNRARVTSIGPVMSYLSDDLKTQVEVKYFHEFSAKARPEGDMALLTFTRLF